MTDPSTEQRLVRLEALREIEHLKYRYARCCDTGYDLGGFRSIFVPHARWSANGFGTFDGIEAICAHFAELSKSVVEVLHYITAPDIEIAGDRRTANARFYLQCLSRSRNRRDPAVIDLVLTMGTYRDRLVRIDGRWFFEEIVVDVGHVTRLGEARPEKR